MLSLLIGLPKQNNSAMKYRHLPLLIAPPLSRGSNTHLVEDVPPLAMSAGLSHFTSAWVGEVIVLNGGMVPSAPIGLSSSPKHLRAELSHTVLSYNHPAPEVVLLN